MKIKVADLVVETEFYYDFMKSRLSQYYCDENEKSDMSFGFPEEFYMDRHKENPQMTPRARTTRARRPGIMNCFTRD